MQENQDDSLAKDPEHVMDTQAMAELFGKSQGTVQKWCREGTIANAVKKEGRWLVEGLPVKRYRVTGRKRYNARKRYMDILKACRAGSSGTAGARLSLHIRKVLQRLQHNVNPTNTRSELAK